MTSDFGFGIGTGAGGTLRNSVNPLTSLVDKEVYGIPVLLLIGWRGEPGKKDEPQHVKLGRITEGLLHSLEIPFSILPDTIEEAEKVLEAATDFMRQQCSPYALVVRAGTFEPYHLKGKSQARYELSREEALKLIIDRLSPEDIVVSTTGKTSRELFEYREKSPLRSALLKTGRKRAIYSHNNWYIKQGQSRVIFWEKNENE